MIKIKQITEDFLSCDSCSIENQPFYLKYEFFDSSKQTKPYFDLILCEDCSCMMSKLHFDCMEDGDSYEYDIEVGDNKKTEQNPMKEINSVDMPTLQESYGRAIIESSLARYYPDRGYWITRQIKKLFK